MSDTDDPLYREIILEHWQNPQNYGVIKDADIDISGNNPLCGDHIRITAKMVNGRVINIGFTAEGCAISKASASLFTEHIKDKSLEEIRRISKEEVLLQLGITISPARAKCAMLCVNTFQKNYLIQ